MVNGQWVVRPLTVVHGTLPRVQGWFGGFAVKFFYYYLSILLMASEYDELA